MKNFLKLLRCHQYIKNLFIFAPLFFAFDFASLQKTILVFGFFCLTASAVYIINDVKDKEVDILHPKKKFRPIASGKITSKCALALSIILLVCGGGVFLVDFWAGIYVSVYVLLNFCYTFWLKSFALFDVCIIAIGFILRLLIGSSVSGIPLSQWIVICTFFLSLFLAFAKRRDDCLQESGTKIRQAIRGYNLIFLDVALAISACMSIFSYTMWSIAPQEHFKSPHLYLTSFFVAFGLLRYLQLVFVYRQGGSPTNLVLSDKILHYVICAWILSFLILEVCFV